MGSRKFNLTIALRSKIVGKLVLTARAARAFYDRGPDLQTDLGTQDYGPKTLLSTRLVEGFIAPTVLVDQICILGSTEAAQVLYTWVEHVF